jgi:HTH-type transcriptional regulator / antitoxin HipB
MKRENSTIETHLIIGSVADLGEYIKAFRSSQEMTQSDISGLANTGNRFIVELENGKETVQLNKVLDVLSALGLELTLSRKSKF